MAAKKIVVCSSRDEAETQKQVLQQDGYQTSGPDEWDRINWGATEAGGTNDIRQNVWVVEGVK